MGGWMVVGGRSLSRTVLVVMLVVAMAACSRAGSDPAESPSPDALAETEATADDPDDLDQSHTFWAWVRVEASGAAEFVWEGTEELVVTRVGRPGLSVNQLTAGFRFPLILKETPEYRFRWAFDLIGAYDDQPGTFTLALPSGKQGVAESMAFLIWMRAKDGSQRDVPTMEHLHFFKQFGRIAEPCTVEVGEGELHGSLSCPRLETPEGEAVTLNVTWRPATDEERAAI